MDVNRKACCVILGWMLVFSLTNGCQLRRHPNVVRPPYTAYRSPNLLADPPRRILVMPVIPTVFDGGYSQRWYHLFTSELRSLNRFEVVNADPEVVLVQQCLEQAKQGLYPEDTLVELARFYRVDGVIFSRMDNFDPYWPPRMSLNVNLVETFNGETLAAVDGNWDARDKCIEVLIQDYAHDVTTSQEMSNPDIFLQSPEYFGKFVANHVAVALCNLFRDERGVPRPELISEPAPVAIANSSTTAVVPASFVGAPLGCAEPPNVGTAQSSAVSAPHGVVQPQRARQPQPYPQIDSPMQLQPYQDEPRRADLRHEELPLPEPHVPLGP